MCGYDDILGGDCKGLFQFEEWRDMPTTSQKWVTRVTFDVTQAMIYQSDNPTLFTDIIGFVFVRGERIDNLIGQGLLVRGFYGIQIGKEKITGYPSGYLGFGTELVPYTGNTGDILMNSFSPTTASIIPLVFGLYPMAAFYPQTPRTGSYGYFRDYGDIGSIGLGYYFDGKTECSLENYFQGGAAYCNSHGLFIPDLLFEADQTIQEETVIEPIFQIKTSNIDDVLYTTPFVDPPYTVLDYNEDIVGSKLSRPAKLSYTALSVSVGKGINKTKFNFTSSHPSPGSPENGYGINIGNYFMNRDIRTSRYIGIVDPYGAMKNLFFNSASVVYPPDRCLTLVNLYKKENNALFQSETKGSFNVSTCLYSEIEKTIYFTEFRIPITTIPPYIVYKGDCFLQKTWFRSHRWYGMAYRCEDPANLWGHDRPEWGRDFIDVDAKYYQYGMMMGLVTECKYNTAARNDITGRDDSLNYINYTFYPRALSYGINKDQWVCYNPGDYLFEATQINDGYNKVFSDKTVIGHDPYAIYHPDKELNRVYNSDKDNPRKIRSTSFFDYCKEDGPITAIRSLLDYPYLVQRDAINQMFISERIVNQTETGQDVIQGVSVQILSDATKKLSDFGSQHKSSMVDGMSGGYGVDQMRRVIWIVKGKMHTTGRVLLTAENISMEGLIEKELKDYLNTYSEYGDIMSIIPDTPLYGSGIVGFVDDEFKEVGFSFLISPSTNEGIRKDRTFIYCEKMQGFKGTYLFGEPIYFTVGTQFMSVKHQLVPTPLHDLPTSSLYQYKPSGDVWLHDQVGDGTNYQNFFGVQQNACITLIFNGSTEGKENALKIMKIFESLGLECVKEDLLKITFDTLYQTSEYDFNTVKLSLKPRYENHRWILPISSTIIGVKQYSTSSEMSGTWIKITIWYGGNKDLELRTAEVNFTPLIEQ
jgi:hypothetical protein